jgi:hypothetical protein
MLNGGLTVGRPAVLGRQRRRSGTKVARGPIAPSERLELETQGPLATVWVGIALGAFYIALIWVNTLLGTFLTPLFIIPITWLLDALGVGTRRATDGTPGEPAR